MLEEVRSSVRRLRRHTGYAVASALSLAVGMSLATAVFSVVQSALFGRLPYTNADRLVEVLQTDDGQDRNRIDARLAAAIRAQATTVSDVAAYTTARMIVGQNGEARTIQVARVSANFFRVLGVGASVGATFEDPGATNTSRSVVLAHSLWSSHFGADTAVIGRSILVGGERHIVTGVMPEAFDGPIGTAAWVSLPMELGIAATREAAGGPPSMFNVVGRLAPGATVETASAEVAVVAQRLASEARQSQRRLSGRVVTLREYVTVEIRDQLRLWAAAAVIILMLCAVNFATMCLAHGMRRRNEFALRAALGASRGQLVRMIVADATLFALVGGGLAVLLAWWLLSFADTWFANSPVPISPTIGWAPLVFGVASATVVGFAFTVAPAVELAAVDLRSVLASMGATTAKRGELRGRRSLVALQMSLALCSVAVVTALVAADRRYQSGEVGFDYSRLITGMVTTVPPNSRVDLSPLFEQLRVAPGVSTAAAVSGCSEARTAPERESADVSEAIVCRVSTDYFATIGVKPTAGRLPTREEAAVTGGAVVISRSLARRVFGSENRAIGRRLAIKRDNATNSTPMIVGVTTDNGAGLLGFNPTVYSVEPVHQVVSAILLLRVDGAAEARVRDVLPILAGVDPRFAISDIGAAAKLVASARALSRARMVFLSVVAALALVLAVIGVFGLTSYTTALRTREFGIRLALGASRTRMAVTVLAELWWMSVIGLVVGILVANQTTTFLDALFRNPMTTTPLVSLRLAPAIASAGALFVIMLLATALPLRRVLRTDVLRALHG